MILGGMIILVVKRNQLSCVGDFQAALRELQCAVLDLQDFGFIVVVNDELHGAGAVQLVHIALLLDDGGMVSRLRKTQRRHQSRRTGADDQYFFFHSFSFLILDSFR